MSTMTRANGAAWDAVAKTHYENYHVGKLLAGESLLNELIRTEVGDVHGKSLIHLLCHIGTDTLSWGLLGARVTGVDISPESIRYAQRLAGQVGVEATFITSDVMDLRDRSVATSDIVFASTGVLCWLPDIERFAAIVRQLLNPEGFFYLHDSHPFRGCLDITERGEAVVKHDYFHTAVQEYDDLPDYTVKDLVIPARTYEWGWTLGDVRHGVLQERDAHCVFA